MRQRVLINLLLLLCVIGAMTVLIVDEEVTFPHESPSLTDLAADSIDVIRVERQGKDDIVFHKQHDHWYMQSPFQLPANPEQIQKILALLHAPSYMQLSAADTNLVPFLLEVPAITVVFNDLRIAFGGVGPLEEKLRYVLLEGMVYLINDGLFYYLQSDTTVFVGLKILPFDAVLRTVKLPTLYIKDAGDEVLSLEQRRFMQAWTQAKAFTVSRYFSAAPLHNVRLGLENNEEMELVVVSTSPTLILGRPDKGVQYHIDDMTATQLLPTTMQSTVRQE